MTLPDVVDFAADLLMARGALVEREEAGALALLPGEVARAFNLPESCRLTAGGNADTDGPGADGPGATGNVSCGFGTPLLEQFIEAARAVVPVAHAALGADPVRLAQARSLAERFAPRNGLAEVIEVTPGKTEYLVSSFAWVAEADDRYEGQLSVALSADDAAEPDEVFRAQVDLVGSSLLNPQAPEPIVDSPERCQRMARALARRVPSVLENALAPVLVSIRRRHVRDHERISEYFGSMIQETLSPRRRVDPEAIRAKVDLLLRERDAKLRDLSTRFALRATVRPAALLRLAVASANVRMLLRRRKESREILLRLPALAQSLDRLTCDGCGAPTGRPALCDDRLHLLCEQCVPNAQGRLKCPACVSG